MADPTPGDNTVLPLFQTRDFLLNTIRMETTTDVQTLALVNQAITDVRLEFYEALGVSRTLAIAAYTYSPTPTTSEEILKARAQVAEAYWVIYKLVPLLPSYFIENHQNLNENFNSEPLTRDSSQVKAYMETLKQAITRNIGQLMVPIEAGDGESAVGLIQPLDDNGEHAAYIVDDNFIGLYRGPV